jgi:hypothetical protein
MVGTGNTPAIAIRARADRPTTTQTLVFLRFRIGGWVFSMMYTSFVLQMDGSLWERIEYAAVSD